jgi:Protein of unknown function (DUF1569)
MDTHLEKLQQVLESAVQGMSQEQMSWHLPGKWCAAQVLEHLYLSYSGTTKGFQRVLEAGKPLATRASVRQRFRIFVVLNCGYLPTGRKAPPAAEPRGLSPETVRNEMATKIEAMDVIIGQCEKRFGAGVALLDHPVLGPLTGKQWRKFHELHGMHHRKQLLRLREASGQD